MKRMFLLFVGFFCISSTFAMNLEVDPFFGVDANWRIMHFKRDFGRGDFRRNTAEVGIFGGFRFCDYYGIEVGGNSSKWVKKSNMKHKIHAFYGSLLGFYPLVDKLELVGSVGLYLTKISCKDIVGIKKLIPRTSLGVQYPITEALSARASYSFDLSRALKSDEIKVKNSSVLNAGILLNF